MGEFSAGKSTVANLMLGSHPLPVQVVATRLPPVKMSYGSGAAFRLDTDGKKHAVDLGALENLPFNETLLIQVYREEDILAECDLIDMPGISDPNMDSEVWRRVLPQADAVIWCTHATQAWRQSEAAVWDQVPKEVRARSLLLLTRIDKVPDPLDRDRLLRRVLHEVGSEFDDCLPIALLAAHAAGDDLRKWKTSGADKFAKKFASIVTRIRKEKAAETNSEMKANPNAPPPEPSEKIVPRRVSVDGR